MQSNNQICFDNLRFENRFNIFYTLFQHLKKINSTHQNLINIFSQSIFLPAPAAQQQRAATAGGAAAAAHGEEEGRRRRKVKVKEIYRTKKFARILNTER